MDIYLDSNIHFDFGAEKVVPKKTAQEIDLYNKWRHVLSREKVNKEIVRLYNKDLKKFLESEEGRKYRQ